MASTLGKVQTVLGIISPAQLGITLPHEHILINSHALYVSPPKGREQGASKGFEMNNLGWIRYFPYSHSDNLHLNSLDLALKEIKLFKEQVGSGATLVDVTTEGIHSSHGRRNDVLSFQKIAQESGVNIICGSGYYIQKSHPEEVVALSIAQLADKIVHEVQIGIDGTGIRAGVIGEIGCSWPLTENEKKVLRAASEAQNRTGCPLIVHPGRNVDAPLEILEILRISGADLSKTVMSHLDRTVSLDDIETLMKIGATKAYLEFDLFGTECSYYQQNETVDMVSDAQRILAVQRLVDVGFTNQLLLSHDIHTKHRLVEFGGHGYSHLPLNIIPRMIKRGISANAVNTMMIDNPRKWLAFTK